jgi:hypothetical protein
MESYQSLYESNHLFEMPYIIVGKDNLIDLEYEKINDPKKLINLLSKILDGQTYKGKYNSMMQLKTDSDKKSFVYNLLDDIMFANIINNKFNDDEFNELEKVLGKWR